MRVLAVDIGGSHVSGAALDDRVLLESFRIETNSRGYLANLLPVLAETFRNVVQKHGDTFVGLAFGFCGLVDGDTGRVVSTNHKYADATDVDLVTWAKQELGLPLILENDTRLALLGECYCGAGQGAGNAVIVTLGTGIGTAAMISGRLLRGKHFQAGCLGGHFTVVLDGRLCSCGAHGCFEAEASTYALPEICRTWPKFEASALSQEHNLDFASLFRCAERLDPVAEQIRDRCLRVWSACALSLVHAYDPELLILGGGVMNNSYPILPTIQQHVHKYAWTPWGKVHFVPSVLGSEAALFGAVPLFHQR